MLVQQRHLADTQSVTFTEIIFQHAGFILKGKKGHLKGTLCRFAEKKNQTLNFYICNMNEVIIRTQKYLSFLLVNKHAVLRGN